MIEQPALAIALLFAPNPFSNVAVDPAATAPSLADVSAAGLLVPSSSALAAAAPLNPVASVPLRALLHDPGPWYLRLNGGLVTTEDVDAGTEEIDFDEGWMIAFAAGNRVTDADRPVDFNIEIETVWTDQDANDDGLIQAVEDVNVATLFLNGMANWHFAQRLSLYGGAGIGPAWLDVGTESGFDDEDGPFLAWQARAGFMWRFAERTGFQIGYRFINVDDAEIDDGGIGNADFDLETQQHVAEVGLCFGI